MRVHLRMYMYVCIDISRASNALLRVRMYMRMFISFCAKTHVKYFIGVDIKHRRATAAAAAELAFT